MGTTLNSFDNMLASAINNGMWSQSFNDTTAATSVASATCGYIHAGRFPRTLTVPPVGAGLTGGIVTVCRLHSGTTAGSTLMAALEYNLGTLTVSGNSFAAGTTMPVKTDPGNRLSTVQTASLIPMLAVNTTLTSATTPTVTITYTNQAGIGGKTATLILGSNPANNSAYCITPHLASGDTGIRAVTNMSISTGTTGSLSVMGLLPLGFGFCETASTASFFDPLAVSFPSFKIEQGETISFWKFVTTNPCDILAHIAAVGEN